MRIAVLGHVRHPIAAPFAGGMEGHCFHLVRALARRGHDVTLFASGDSDAGVPVWPVVEEHYDRVYPWHEFAGTAPLDAHLDAAFARAGRALLDGDYDVVHNNALHRYPPRLARATRLPMLTSLHVPPFQPLQRSVRGSVASWSRVSATSRRQVAAWWPDGAPEEVAVVPNGIDLAQWPFVERVGAGAVWAGRITPNKGPHVAAMAAARASMPLTIFGGIEHRDYFEAQLRPLLGSGIRYGGHLDGRELAREFGKAAVMLFTPLWDEPFGLAAIEAMATGLPVAAIDNGAVREVIGDAGAFAAEGDIAGLAAALVHAADIPRSRARRRVEERFSIDRMVDRYERLYDAARGGLDAAPDPVVFAPHELAIASAPRGSSERAAPLPAARG
jgi:glycosyltransferase involved in cell wall biosynthesis